MPCDGNRQPFSTSRRLLCLFGVALLAFALLADHIVGGAPGFGLQQAALAAAGLLLAALSLAPARVIRGVLTMLVTTGLALVAAELVVRSSYGREFAVIYRADEELLHGHIPNARKVFVHRRANEGRKIDVRINSHGFRGPELDVDRNVPRIVVLGDSNVAAEFSTWEASFCGQLARELGRVEVVNTGVIGYGPDQSLLLLERELDELQPQLVVAVLFADNDFGDLIRNKLFRLGPDGELVRHRVQVADEFRAQLELARKTTVLEHVFQRMRQRRLDSTRARGMEPGLDRWTAQLEDWLELCRVSHDEYVNHPDRPAHAMFQDHYDADIALEPWSESAQLKLRLMRGVLARMRERCAASGVPLLLVVLPSRVDLCDDLEFAWVDRARWPQYRSRALTEAFTRIADELGIPYLDLYPPFRAGEPCALYLRGGDSHWNEAGQALAAQLVADKIRADFSLEH